jgi:GTPase SAR1 family protein
MGKINSKAKNNYRFPTIFQSELLTSCQRKNDHIDIHEFSNKQRLCMKKKVLMLGLDGVGKTDLFNRLICQDQQSSKSNPSPQPTMGIYILKNIFNY